MTVNGKLNKLVEKASNKAAKFLSHQNRGKMELQNKRNSKMEKKSSEKPGQKPLLQVVINLVYRFISVIVRYLMKHLFFGETGLAMPSIKNLILLESAGNLALKIRTKKLTSVEVVSAFIERIKEVNPQLNCVVDDRFSEALKEAADADKLIASGTLSQEQLMKELPFLGVPISTKDCISVKNMLNTSGIWARRNIRSEKDSPAMAKMRNAGAIPFAITNVSECCMWWESSNPVHGRTNNPYDNNRIVGGSSGGEGCLQACAGSPFGLGSDIGGSIRMPAFFNGIFGHKPTKFVVSNFGQYPAAHTEAQNLMLGIGPMSRFATDLKPMLKVLAEEDKLPLLRLDETVDLKKIKFYYQETDGGANLVSPIDSDIKDALQKVVVHLKTNLKAEVNRIQVSRMVKGPAIWIANMKSNDSPGFDSQLANLDGKINVWGELFKWMFGCSKHTLIGLLTAVTENKGVVIGTPKYNHLMEEKKLLVSEFEEMLDENSVFLYPTHPTVAPYHNEPLFRALNFSYTAIINVLGMPACNIPLGLGREQLPLGIQVVGGYHQDRLCLAVACELERAFGGWVAPDIE